MGFLAFLVVFVVMLVESFMFKLLWNWIVIGVFALNLPVLTIWSALGLIILLNFISSIFKHKSSKNS